MEANGCWFYAGKSDCERRGKNIRGAETDVVQRKICYCATCDNSFN